MSLVCEGASGQGAGIQLEVRVLCSHGTLPVYSPLGVPQMHPPWPVVCSARWAPADCVPLASLLVAGEDSPREGSHGQELAVFLPAHSTSVTRAQGPPPHSQLSLGCRNTVPSPPFS